MHPRFRRLRDRVGGGSAGQGVPDGTAQAVRRSGARPRGGGRQRKTFVLGLGSQKGGTSWLHRYLAGSPQYAKGWAKEYHFFDSLDLDPERRARMLEEAAAELEKARQGEPYRASVLHWAAMCGHEALYYDYFAGLLARRPATRATGDITPAYSQLSAERVAGIRQGFQRRRVRTVALFLMRDPVERVWSAARMLDRRSPDQQDLSPEQVVERCFADPHYDSRTRYDQTLRVLDEVFDPADRWVGFYEELFDADRVREVCEVVGIRFREPDLETRYNASPKAATLPDELVATVAEHFRGVYEVVGERFPEKDLARLWPSSRFLG